MMAGVPRTRSSIVLSIWYILRFFYSEIVAVTRERQLKRWSHEKKQALVEGNVERLKHASKHRS
jgi:predicted GIY-YIG superfamily endonuclease